MFGWLGGDFNEGDLLFLGDWGLGTVVVLGLLGALVLGLSWYDLRDMTRARRWSLIVLRLAVYGLAVLVLLEPALELKNVTRVKNHVAVLVDNSRSQSLKVDEEGTTRLDRARAALQEDGLGQLLGTPHEDHVFDVFTFGADLKPSTLAEAQSQGLRADQDDTKLLEALEEATRRIGKRDLGGVIILSDGIDGGKLGGRVRRGEPLDDETEAFLQRLEAPVHTLATASSEGLKDLSVERVHYDDFAFVRNKISIDVTLKVVGFEPERIPVTLRREGQILQTREVEVGPDATEYKLSFELVPQQIGKEIYTISAPAYAGEALVENNRKDIVLKIIRDKIRALHVVGRPSWDERFLRQLLKRNPNVDLVSFFILRTSENAQVGGNDELSLIPFPTRELFEEELGSFDLVIFQNFNFRPYNVEQYLGRVAQYVRDGGGFVMVGGDLSFTSGAYQGTPIEGVLPVLLAPPGPREALVSEAPFQLQLTDAGQRHPITQLTFDPGANVERWSKLPALEGANLVLGPRPGATVLATHPNLKAGGQPMPVIAIQEVGKGRSMAVTTDSTWSWGFYGVARGGTTQPYHTFWSSAMRWLIKDPELKLIKVDIDAATVAPGSDVPLTVSVAKPDYTPAADVEGTLELRRTPLETLVGEQAEPPAPIIQSFKTDSRGRFEFTLPHVESGAYTVKASARTEAGELTDQDLFLVTLDSQELRTIEPREDLLQLLAKASGGDFHRLPDLDRAPSFKEARVEQVNRRKVIDLWDTLWMLVLICGLLGAEWSLRRRWGRL
jgi:uncharacterized membrane protein